MTRIAGLLIVACMATIALAEDRPSEPTTLTFIWHDGPCADAFERIAARYPDSGVRVKAMLLPYGPEWHDRISSEFDRKGDSFDIAMWDSQSTAEFASAGHAYSINEVFAASESLDPGLFDRASLARYGEYPDGSGRFWGLPVNQDAYGLMYRKDLLEDAAEQEAFRERYGYPLGIPQTYDHARDIAEFFTRPEENLFGWGQMGGRPYDFATTASNSFLWSFGGELYNPETFEVGGYLNSPASVDGVQRYVDMFEFGPPGSRDWGWEDVNDAWREGRLAMAMQWYSFHAANADASTNPLAVKTGFANLPGAVGRDGKFRRQFSVGGQGMGINAHSKKIPQVIEFMEWYFQPEQQKEYAASCQTALRTVLDSAEWQNLNGYNRQFAEGLAYTNDYWHLPEYSRLLEVLQEEVNAAVHGKKTVANALRDAATRHEAILERSGHVVRRAGGAPVVPDQNITPVGRDTIVPLRADRASLR